MEKKIIFVAVVIVANLWTLGAQAESFKEYKDKLPEWLEIGGDVRHRYEWRKDFDLNDAVDDDHGFNLWRTRLNFGIKPNDHLKFFYQFQDSRISHDSLTTSKSTYENWVDHRQLWVEGKTDALKIEAVGLSDVAFKVGRQELAYGDQRLIGTPAWSNIYQSFDAARLALTFKEHDLSLDIFGGQKVLVKSPREMDDFYSGDDNDRLLAYYVTYKGLKDLVIDQYLFYRDTQGKTVSFGQTGDGALSEYTFGARVKGKIAETPLDFEIEAAKQSGQSGVLDIDAQMFIGVLGYTFDHAWKPRLAFEFDYGSGDSDSADGKRKTFDNLYPNNHSPYGTMDFTSLQNIHDYRLQLKTSPTQKLSLQGDYHLFYLDTPKDGWYAANRAVKRAGAVGADSFVGSEIDVITKYKTNDYLDFMIGYSHFFAGDFLEDTGSADDADFVYVQTTVNF